MPNIEALEIDSLEFEVSHVDVLYADSLLAYNQLDQAFSIYDSLLSVQLDDPYLEQYILGQSFRKDLRNMSDSLFQIRIETLEAGLVELSSPVTCLELQKSFLEGYWLYYSQSNHTAVEKKLNHINKIPAGNYPVQFSTILYENYHILSWSYAHVANDHYRSREYRMIQEAMLQGNVFISPRQIGLLYYALSISSYFLEDYELSVEYGLKSQSYFEEIGNKRLLGFAKAATLNNYPILKDSIAADKTFEELKLILENGDLQESSAYTFLLNYAGSSYDSDDIKRFEMALDEANEYLPESDTINLTKFIEQKSWLLEEKGKYKEAEQLQKKAIRIYNQYSEKERFQISNYLSNLGLLYKQMELFDSACYYLHKGIELELELEFDLKESPIAGVNFASESVFESITGLAHSLQESQYPTGDSLKNKELANEYYDRILADWESYSDLTEEGLLRNINNLNDLIKQSIYCKYKLNRTNELDLEGVYSLMEKGKALLLQKSVYKRALADLYGVPDTVFQSLLDIEEELASRQIIEEVDEEIGASNYVGLIAEKEKIQNEIKDIYPNYYNAISEPSQMTLKELQSKLPKKHAVLEYASADFGTFVLGVTTDKVKLKFIPSSDSLTAKIDQFFLLINKKPSGDLFKEAEKYGRIAHTLDSLLIGDIFKGEVIETFNVVPDGAINKVPFEALVVDYSVMNEGFFELDYRIKSSAVNYSFSSSLLFGKSKKQIANPIVHLFAYSAQTELANLPADEMKDELPASGREVDLIERILGERSIAKYKGQSCTKENFQNSLQTADVIHLAVHGNADTENKYGNRLRFKNVKENQDKTENYYGFELKGINLKPKFVFLGACESGKGKIYNGEGVYSLGRNFAAAGVPSVVMGLWKLNDEVSQEMVSKFYENLRKGEVPAEALKRAKIAFLENSDDRMAHPFYWAPFISIGKNSRIFN